MPENPNRLLVAGVGLRGAGYPNACNTLRMLRSTRQIEVVECGSWLPEDTLLWKISKGPLSKAIPFLVGMLVRNAWSASRLLLKRRAGDIAYVPYPGIFLLWLLSWAPRRWRPRCICDAYITIWDSLYEDRGMGAADSSFSRLLLRIEARALNAAECVIVDTVANANHLHQLFGVPRERILAFPLALDASTLPIPGTRHEVNGKIRVLFIGTFVPLQGTLVIARAIDALRAQKNLKFVVIGDGQQAAEVAPLLEGNPNVCWRRGWQPPHVLAQELALADICLGVFGGEAKATRVLPIKVYLALAAGKPVITQDGYSVPDGCPAVPAVTCAPAAPPLAQAITELAENRELRVDLAHQAGKYFQEYLSRDSLIGRWRQLLGQIAPH